MPRLTFGQLKVTFFQGVMPCSLVDRCQRFGGTRSLQNSGDGENTFLQCWYLTIHQSAHRTPKENSVHGYSCGLIRGFARLGLAYSQKNYCDHPRASRYSFLPGADPGFVGPEAYAIKYNTIRYTIKYESEYLFRSLLGPRKGPLQMRGLKALASSASR